MSVTFAVPNPSYCVCSKMKIALTVRQTEIRCLLF